MSNFHGQGQMLLQCLSKQESRLKEKEPTVSGVVILDPGDAELNVDETLAHVSAASYGSFIHGSEDEFRQVNFTLLIYRCE